MARSSLLCLLVLVAFAGCGSRRSAPTAPRALSPDSAALLERAVRLARPAFATQAEALRSGAYQLALDTAAAAPELPPAPATRADAPAPGGGAVIQIGAFRDRPSADRLARDARGHFAGAEVVVEGEDGWYRVVLTGWTGSASTERELERVRKRYPGAWVRSRSVP